MRGEDVCGKWRRELESCKKKKPPTSIAETKRKKKRRTRQSGYFIEVAVPIGSKEEKQLSCLKWARRKRVDDNSATLGMRADLHRGGGGKRKSALPMSIGKTRKKKEKGEPSRPFA